MTTTTTPTSGAADLPAIISGALFDFAGFLTTLDKSRAVTFSGAHEAGPAVTLLQEWSTKRGLNLDEADVSGWRSALTARAISAEPAQAVVQDDLITLRKPTTSAELLWLLKLAHLVISDVDKTLEEAFAPAQPAAQQGAAYAALPEPDIAVGNDGRARIYTRKDIVGEPYYTAGQLRAFADATHTLRASHGQASSQAGEYPALVCDYCGALTPDPWHSSGMLHGKMSKHIHSCDACAARGAAQAQAAKQQEQLI